MDVFSLAIWHDRNPQAGQDAGRPCPAIGWPAIIRVALVVVLVLAGTLSAERQAGSPMLPTQHIALR